MDLGDLRARLVMDLSDVAGQLATFAASLKDSVAPPDTSGTKRAFEELGVTAEKTGEAIQDSVKPPDTGRTIAAFSAVADTAESAADTVKSAFADAAIPVIDNAAAISGITAISDAATVTAESTRAAFGDIAIPTLDSTQAVSSMEAIATAAKAVAGEVVDDLSVQMPALDTSTTVGSLATIPAAAQAAAQEIAADLSAPTPALDVTNTVGSMAAISDAAKTTEEAVIEAFSQPLPTEDVSGYIDGLTQIDTKLGELEQEYGMVASAAASLSGSASDVSSAIGQETDAIMTGSQALQVLIDKFNDGEITVKEFSSAANALASAMQAAGQDAAAMGQGAGEAADGVNKLSMGAQELVDQQTKLDAELAQAISVLGEIHDAYVEDAVSADVLAKAEAAVEAAIKAAGSAVETAANQTKQYSDAAQAIIDSQKRLDDQLTVSRGALAELEDAYARGAVGERELAEAASQVSDAFAKANPDIKSAGQNAADAAGNFSDLGSEILKLAGITVSIEALKELALGAIEASDKLDDAAYAIGRFNGSAQVAKDTLNGLFAVAQDERLSFPTLVTAAQRMSALGFSGQDTIEILAKLGNAAELTGNSIEGLARKFTAMVDGGAIGTKQLEGMGIKLDDVEKAMVNLGATADLMSVGVKKAWAELDGSQKAAVMTEALSKLDGAAKAMGDDIKGAGVQAMNEFYAIMAKFGDVIAPLAQQMLPSLVTAIKVLVTGLDAGITSFKILIDVVTTYASVLGTAYTAVAQAANSVSKMDFSGAASAVTGAIDTIKTKLSGMKDQIEADVKLGASIFDQVWNVQIPASVDSGTKKVKVNLSDVVVAHKQAAMDIQAAFQAVSDFETKIASDTTVGQLQRDFESASKAIGMVAKEDLPAAIAAVDAYTVKLGEVHAGTAPFLQDFQEQSKLIQQLAKGDLRDAIQAWTDYIGILDKAGAPIGIIQAALEQEEKDLQQLAKEDIDAANRGWDALIQKLKDTNAPLAVLNKALQDHQKFLTDTADAAIKAADAFTKAALAYANFNIHAPEVTRALNDAYDSLKNLGIIAVDIPPKISPVNQAMIDFGLAAQKAKAPVLDLKTPIDELVGSMQKLASEAQKSGDWSAFNGALDEFDKRIQNIAKTDLPEAAKQMETWIQGMINAGAPTEMVQGQLSKLEPLLKKMAEEDLPGAQAAWQNYLNLLNQVPAAIQSIQQQQEQQIEKDKTILAGLQQRGAAYGYILDQQGKVLQEEIAYAEKTGQDANDLVLGLEKVRLKQEEIRLSTHGVADEYVKMIGDVLKGFDQLGGAMADAIVNGKNLGDALVGQFKKIGQSILTDLINAALVPLKTSLIELIGSLLPGMAGGLNIVGGSLGTVNASAGTAATGLNNLAAAANAAATSINNSIGSGGDVNGGGGLASTIGAVGAVAAAGAAIASAILLAHISSDTGHIEVNTRSTLAEVGNVRADNWSIFGQTYDRLGDIMNATNRVVDAIGKLSLSTGGLSPTDSKNLADTAANTNSADSMLSAIQANTQYTVANTATTFGNVADGTNQITNWLAVVNNSILGVITALTYGSRSPATQSYQTDSTTQDLASAVRGVQDATTDSAHAITSAIDDMSASQALSVGAADAHRSADDDQIIARQNAILAAAQSQLNSSLGLDGQLSALRAEYAAYQKLQAEAIQQASQAQTQEEANHFLNLAQQYATAAQQTSAQLTSLIGTGNTLVSSANSIYGQQVAGSTQVSMAATGAGILVSTAVQSSASQISNAVIASASASASIFSSSIGTLISVAGAWGAPGGGTRTGTSGTTGGTSPTLPNGSGGATVGTAQYGPPSTANPGIPVGQQPSFGPVDPLTGKPISSTPPNTDFTPNVGPIPKAPVIETSTVNGPAGAQGEVYTSTSGSTSISSTKPTNGLPGVDIVNAMVDTAKAITQAVAPNTPRDKNAQGPVTNAANFDPVAAAAASGQDVWQALQDHYDAVNAVIAAEAAARAGAAVPAQSSYTSTGGSTSISGTSGPAAPAGYTSDTLPKAMQDAAKAISDSATMQQNQLKQLQDQLVAANQKLADATATGDKAQIALAQAQLDSLHQLMVAVNNQTAATGATLPTTSTGTSGTGTTATAPAPAAAPAFDPAPLYNWLSTIAGWMKTEVDATNQSASIISDRAVWGSNTLVNAILDLYPHIDIGSNNIVSTLQLIGKGMNLPSFDIGGPVRGNQIARIHDGEFIIPPSPATIKVPSDVLARIDPSDIQGAMNLSSPGTQRAGSTGGAVPQVTVNQTFHWSAYGVNDPVKFIEGAQSDAKLRSSKLSPYSN